MYEQIEEGLWLFTYPKSKFYQMRMIINGEDVRKSTRQTDRNKAIAEAVRMKLRAEGTALAGLQIKQNTKLNFGRIARETTEELQKIVDKSGQKRPIQKDYISIINNHIIPYFYKKQIDKVDIIDIEEYLNKLESKSKTTLQKQQTALSHVYQHAVRKRIIKQVQVPDFKMLRVEPDEKEKETEEFQDEDLLKIAIAKDAYIESTKHKLTKHYREAFFHYFKLLIDTGMRPGEEVRGIKYEHIKKVENKKSAEKYYVIKIEKGKTQKGKFKYREIAISLDTAQIIFDLSKVLIGHRLHSLDKVISKYKEYPILLSHKSNNIPQFDDIMRQNEFPAFAQLSKHYTLYSCRTTYINQRIRAGDHLNNIAEDCGTSVAVIEKHYKRLKLSHSMPEHIKRDSKTILDIALKQSKEPFGERVLKAQKKG
jgi:integrase